MSIRLDKPWRTLDEGSVEALPGQLGVYELADKAGTVVLIGYAGGHSLFGLRSELSSQLSARGEGSFLFRCEVTMQYMSRYQELLMLHFADHGELPRDNNDDVATLGRLSPA